VDEERILIELNVGAKLFEFSSEAQWVGKGKSWYANCGTRDHVTIDARGRICTRGEHFHRAELDGTYPLSVYAI
jgi:hypothetical protein